MRSSRAAVATPLQAVLLAVLLAVLPAAAAAAVAIDTPLTPPTSTRYGDTAYYELVDVRVLEGDLVRLQVELGAIDPSGGLPVGITQPIVEVYLDTEPGGASALLPGSGLLMPDEVGWNVAIRITGDGAWAWFASEEGAFDLLDAVPLEAAAGGRVVQVLTPFERPETVRLFAISGVYDPFRADGWRPLSREPSPWAFSSATLAFPVVDVYPADASALARTLEIGVLPFSASRPFELGAIPWYALMFLGLALAVVGLWWRRGATVGRPVVAPPPAPSAATEAVPGGGEVATAAGALGGWTTVVPPGPIMRPGAGPRSGAEARAMRGMESPLGPPPYSVSPLAPPAQPAPAAMAALAAAAASAAPLIGDDEVDALLERRRAAAAPDEGRDEGEHGDDDPAGGEGDRATLPN